MRKRNVMLLLLSLAGMMACNNDVPDSQNPIPYSSDTQLDDSADFEGRAAEGTPKTESDQNKLVLGDYQFSFKLGGYKRFYKLHVPAKYNGSAKVALVLDFHGILQSSTVQQRVSGFAEKSEEEGFIVAYPEGISWANSGMAHSWNADSHQGSACWDQRPYSWASFVGVDDIKYSVEVVEDIARRFNIDRRRIYLTGISQGGAMALLLAHDRGDIFAAAAIVSSALLKDLDQYKPLRPIPVINFHGYNDETVPYEKPPCWNSVEDLSKQWARANGCDCDHPTETSVEYPCFLDQTNREETRNEKITTYKSCKDNAEVRLYSLVGRHTLYNTNQHCGKQFIADEAWDFLKRFAAP